MADSKLAYDASSNLTVTNLHSIATSPTWVSGWTSGTIDNSSDLFEDFAITGEIKVAASGLAVGRIQIYLYGELDDSNWPDILSAGTEGTEGTATLHDTPTRDNSLVMLDSLRTDTTADQIYPFGPLGVVAAVGLVPRKFALFIAQSTGQNLAASGNQVTTKGIYRTVT